MQIVIKIDDKLYKKLQNEKKLSLGLTHIGMKLLDAPPLSSDTQLYNNIVDIGWAIKDGIPLPKNHGRIIDEKDIFPLYHCTSGVYCDHKDCATCQFHSVAEYELDNVSTLIEEVK